MAGVPLQPNAGLGPRFFCLLAAWLAGAACAQQPPAVTPLRSSTMPGLRSPLAAPAPPPPAAAPIPDVPSASTGGRVHAPTAALRARLAAQLHPEALRLHRSGDADGALEALAPVVAAGGPAEAANRFFLAVLLDRRGRAAQAAAEYQAVIRLEPQWADARMALGDLAVRTGDPAGALAHFQQAGALNPEDALPRCRQHLCLLLTGQTEAAEALRAATPFTRDDPDFHFVQAAHHFQHSKPEVARYLLAAARQMYPPERVEAYQAPFAALGWTDP